MRKHKKDKKNRFERICDELEEKYGNDENQIIFVRKYVVDEIKNDYELLLKIQAEATDEDYVQHLAIRISTIAMVFSAIGVILQLIPDINPIVNSLLNLLYLGLVIWIMVKTAFFNKYDSVKTWRKYLLPVLEEQIAILEMVNKNGNLDYKKTYDKAIKYLAAGECPPCEYDDAGRNEECIYCMEHDLDNQEKKIACWRKQFETE